MRRTIESWLAFQRVVIVQRFRRRLTQANSSVRSFASSLSSIAWPQLDALVYPAKSGMIISTVRYRVASTILLSVNLRDVVIGMTGRAHAMTTLNTASSKSSQLRPRAAPLLRPSRARSRMCHHHSCPPSLNRTGPWSNTLAGPTEKSRSVGRPGVFINPASLPPRTSIGGPTKALKERVLLCSARKA